MVQVAAHDVKEEATKRAQRRAALVQQNKVKRSNKRADGGVHAISNDAHPSKVQEAADLTDLGLPTETRYVRASHLPGVQAPSGYYVKWVRRDNRTRGDCAGLTQHLSEGWVIAKRKMFPKQDLPTSHLTSHGEVIGNADTILMIAKIEMVQDRNRQIRERTDRATRGVHEESGLRGVVTPQMPLVEDVMKSKGQLHRMRKKAVAPADDEADE